VSTRLRYRRASTARDAAARAAEIHANGYLGKPFDIHELLALVGYHTAQA